MDFSLSKAQIDLQKKARAIIEKEFSIKRIREVEQVNAGFSRPMWKKAIQSGWTQMTVPKAFGGTGKSLLDTCILLEEIGRSGATLPLVSTIGLSAAILRDVPDGTHRDRCLGDIAAGKIISPALIDPEGRNEWGGARLPITADGDAYHLSGEKVLVPFGCSADEWLVSVVLPDGEAAIILVDGGAKGVSTSRHHAGAGTPMSTVQFKDVRVSKNRVILQGKATSEVLQNGLLIGALLSTAEAIGHSEAIKNMTAEYVSKREAFGRPIGTFQAVSHRCADMHIANETIRTLTYEAAWLTDNDKDAVEEIMTTKALANELFERAANDAFCVHGAEGYYEGCDLQIFMRRIRGFCLTMGETHETLERAAIAIGM